MKVSSNYLKLPGGGLRGSITEYMVLQCADNHQLLLQCAEHDLEEAQWHDGAGDQTINCQFLAMLSLVEKGPLARTL
jgi:hypothetical protein